MGGSKLPKDNPVDVDIKSIKDRWLIQSLHKTFDKTIIFNLKEDSVFIQPINIYRASDSIAYST